MNPEELIRKMRLYGAVIDENEIYQVFDELNKKPEDKRIFVFGVLEVLLKLKPDKSMIFALIGHFGDLKDFFENKEILLLIENLSKLEVPHSPKKAGFTHMRRMFLSLVRDIRVVFLRLAERYYNLKIFSSLSNNEKRILAFEGLNLYVPVAKALGLYEFKKDFEDLCFYYLWPKEYEDIKKQVEKYSKKTETHINTLKEGFSKVLSEANLEGEVEGRIKNLYRIYDKLKRKNHTLVSEIYDVMAFRIIVPDNTDLYTVLGLLHRVYKPLKDRFKDYVASPKPNGYKSLHTTLLGIDKDAPASAIEVQIRTESMHREAESGYNVSHLFYELNKNIEWVRTLADLQNKVREQKNESGNTFSDRIFVLTPKGEIKDLPNGATPIDFAYTIHTEIGNHCHSAKVNGKIVPLDYKLENGDNVEIITRQNAQPSTYWLSFAKSENARYRIAHFLKNIKSEEEIRKGKDIFNKFLAKAEKPSLDPTYSILKNFGGKKLNVRAREDILRSIASGSINPGAVISSLFSERIHRKSKLILVPERNLNKEVALQNEEILVQGEKGVLVKFGRCCIPKKCDKIAGYTTRGRGITIHNILCPTLNSLDKKRVVTAEWLH